MYFRFAEWVASHASLISFKQNTITSARRGLSRCQQFTALRGESEVLIPTEEFAVDLGLCLLREKPTVPFFVTSNRCIPVKKYIGLKYSHVLCVWDNTVIVCSFLPS
jgi:hypothetical protein